MGRTTVKASSERVAKQTLNKPLVRTKINKPVSVAPKRVKAVSTMITASERQDMIAKAAYFLAEARGFNDGDPKTDWLIAEQQIDTLLMKAASKPASSRPGK